MRNLDFIHLSDFQTFYVSKEKSQSILIPSLIELKTSLVDSKILKKSSGFIISHRYGKRMLINVHDVKLEFEDFIEVVDYDPIKNILMVIGSESPNVYTSLHWMIMHAKEEINVIVEINDKDLFNNFKDKLPNIAKEKKDGFFGYLKKILKELRNNNKLLLDSKGLIFVGNNLKEVKTEIIKTCEV